MKEPHTADSINRKVKGETHGLVMYTAPGPATKEL